MKDSKTYFKFPYLENCSPILVTGTSTEVGKTFISESLISSFKEQFSKEGKSIFAIKPIETGCREDESGELLGEDVESLKRALSIDDSRKKELYYKLFRSPVAPIVAEEAEKERIVWEDLVNFIVKSTQENSSEIFLIEGAGGLLVPITKGKSYLDLAKELNLSVLLVVPNMLGCLNQALLTLKVLKEEGVKIAGYIFNEFEEGSEKTLEEELKEGIVSSKNTNRETLKKLASEFGAEEAGYVCYKKS